MSRQQTGTSAALNGQGETAGRRDRREGSRSGRRRGSWPVCLRCDGGRPGLVRCRRPPATRRHPTPERKAASAWAAKRPGRPATRPPAKTAPPPPKSWRKPLREQTARATCHSDNWLRAWTIVPRAISRGKRYGSGRSIRLPEASVSRPCPSTGHGTWRLPESETDRWRISSSPSTLDLHGP